MAFTHSSVNINGNNVSLTTTKDLSPPPDGNFGRCVTATVQTAPNTTVEETQCDVNFYTTGTPVPGTFIFSAPVVGIVSIDMRTSSYRLPDEQATGGSLVLGQALHTYNP